MKESHSFVSVGVMCGTVIGANCVLWYGQEHVEQAAGRHLVETN